MSEKASLVWPPLYVKTAAGNINFWNIWTEGAEVCTCWGKVGTKSPLTDRYTAVAKNVGRANETTPEDQAKAEAQSKFDKQVRLKYVRSIDEAVANVNIKPMRAYTLDDKRAKKLAWPVHVQPKLNGVRCMAYTLPGGSVRLMSRGGKDYSVAHIQQKLIQTIPTGYCLDGELYLHGASLQHIRHLIETPSEESLKLALVVYDYTFLPPSRRPWADRYADLMRWFTSMGYGVTTEVILCPTEVAKDMEDVKRIHAVCTADGYEGVMVRTMKGAYRMAAKSTDLLKFKTFQDDEFKVVGWSVGKDGVIKYRCVQEDGLEFEVRPMGTDSERAELLEAADSAVGKLLTVRFQERSDDNIPIFPVGVAFRPEEDLD